MPAATPSGSLPVVHAGFIPLADCAAVVMARELALDRELGFQLVLHREASWANIRDKVDIGALHCAHMLAPMPIAATLGLGRATRPVIAPMSLSLNGNAITVSLPLFEEMREADAFAVSQGGMAAAKAVRTVVTRRQSEGRAPLTFGMVYPFSAHNYDLRCWLASANIDPDNDVNLIVVPPPLLTQSLKAGRVDGFCVGAPWNSVAVAEGIGAIVATKNELWAASPEKVLGVGEAWAERNAELLKLVVRALVKAGQWLDRPENWAQAARILAEPRYVGVNSEILLALLTGELDLGAGQNRDAKDWIIFHKNAASFPWRSHALWFLTQMVRWGQVRMPFRMDALAQRVYRADIYRQAVSGLDIDVPEGDMRREDSRHFFNGEKFDALKPFEYLNQVSIKSPATDLADFEALNS